MVSRLKNGDILIILDSKFPNDLHSDQISSALNNTANHGMVYGNDENQERVYHAFSGNYLSGVKSHLFNKTIDKDNAKLGDVAILRCPDETLCKFFMNIVKNWDPKLSKEEIKKLPVIDNLAQLPTRFTNFFSRSKDAFDVQSKHELFRAFRAHARNHESPPTPLSKNKGVSCSNFIGYSFKAAMIDRLFPNGIPSEIETLLNDHFKERSSKEKFATKLKDVDINFYKKFEEVVKKNIVDASQLPDELKNIYFAFLTQPVKGYGINHFCENIKKFPELLSFAGFLFYQQSYDNNPSQPFVMDYNAYTKLTHTKEVAAHSIEVSQKHLIENGIGVDIAPMHQEKNEMFNNAKGYIESNLGGLGIKELDDLADEYAITEVKEASHNAAFVVAKSYWNPKDIKTISLPLESIEKFADLNIKPITLRK